MEYIVTIETEDFDLDFLRENVAEAKSDYASNPTEIRKKVLDDYTNTLKMVKYYKKHPKVTVTTLEEYFGLYEQLGDLDIEVDDKGRTIRLI